MFIPSLLLCFAPILLALSYIYPQHTCIPLFRPHLPCCSRPPQPPCPFVFKEVVVEELAFGDTAAGKHVLDKHGPFDVVR